MDNFDPEMMDYPRKIYRSHLKCQRNRVFKSNVVKTCAQSGPTSQLAHLKKCSNDFARNPTMARRNTAMSGRRPGITYNQARMDCAKCTASFRAKLDKTVDPNCTDCGVPETVEHVLLDCGRYSAERGEMWFKIDAHRKQIEKQDKYEAFYRNRKPRHLSWKDDLSILQTHPQQALNFFTDICDKLWGFQKHCDAAPENSREVMLAPKWKPNLQEPETVGMEGMSGAPHEVVAAESGFDFEAEETGGDGGGKDDSGQENGTRSSANSDAGSLSSESESVRPTASADAPLRVSKW